jgi:hypothetical protein
LEVEIQLLNSVLSISVHPRPLTAILTLFANIQLKKLPNNMLTNVFKALISCEDQGVWHRALFILTEYVE